jgi:hypothetical protein
MGKRNLQGIQSLIYVFFLQFILLKYSGIKVEMGGILICHIFSSTIPSFSFAACVHAQKNRMLIRHSILFFLFFVCVWISIVLH